VTQEEKAVGVRILIKPNEGAKSSVMRNCNLLQFVQESLADDDAVIGDYEPKKRSCVSKLNKSLSQLPAIEESALGSSSKRD
jgi:hypothetical protein